MENATPPIIGSGSFDFKHNKNDYLLYVPYGSKSTYAAAPGWESFTVIEEYTPITVEINKDNEAINNLYYDLNGNIVNVPANGIYIKNGKKIWIK